MIHVALAFLVLSLTLLTLTVISYVTSIDKLGATMACGSALASAVSGLLVAVVLLWKL